MKDTVTSHYKRARVLALREVERLAREVLPEYPEGTEFIMGMGTWTVRDAHFEYEPLEVDMSPAFKRLADFLWLWDEALKLTGEPMRFTATGPKITKW